MWLFYSYSGLRKKISWLYSWVQNLPYIKKKDYSIYLHSSLSSATIELRYSVLSKTPKKLLFEGLWNFDFFLYKYLSPAINLRRSNSWSDSYEGYKFSETGKEQKVMERDEHTKSCW